MERDTTATRRAFLQATGAIGVGSTITLAGCVGGGSGSGSNEAEGNRTNNSSSDIPSGGDASVREQYNLPELDYEPENTLNVFQWTGYWPTETIKNFERAYRVNVRISNFASNEQMFNKLRAGGSGQYDVIFPTQNMLFILESQDLIQPLNKKKIPTWDNLAKEWRGSQPYDPGQKRYSMPCLWGTSGVGWNTNMVDGIGDTPSWDLMWNEQYKGQMPMLNSPRETLGASLMRLGYSLNAKDQSKIKEAKEALIEQKPLLKTYNSVNTTSYLQNRSASPVHTWNGDAMQAYAALQTEGESESPVKYQVPEEGGLKWLDTMAITKNASHENAAHALGTYLLNAKVGAKLAKWNGYATPNEAAQEQLPDTRTDNEIINPSDSTRKNLEFVNRFAQSPDIVQLYSEAWTEIQNA